MQTPPDNIVQDPPSDDGGDGLSLTREEKLRMGELGQATVQLQLRIDALNAQLKPLRADMREQNDELVVLLNKARKKRLVNATVMIRKRKKTTKGAITINKIHEVLSAQPGQTPDSVAGLLEAVDVARERKVSYKIIVTPREPAPS